jgi:hypothetical protein
MLVAALLGYLAWGRGEVAASGPQAPFDLAQDRPFDLAQDRPLAQSGGMRQYYLTTSTHNGSGADGTDGNGADVCAPGYHFASLWEIMDPSNLEYNTDLGRQKTDSGQGPPSDAFGRVRTGYDSRAFSSSPAGHSNCYTWTSSNFGDWGTVAGLRSNWTAGDEDIHVWEVSTWRCSTNAPVWCVADDVAAGPGSGTVYLPIILKNH